MLAQMLEALQQPVCSLREFYEQLNLTDHSLDNAQQFFPYFETNNKIAHQLCAECGLAPQLLYYNKDEIYDLLWNISMEIHSALQKLHEKELVFGDLCKSNIMIQEDIDCMKHVKLIDFEWCGIEDQAFYPAFINHEINWPSGVSDKKPLYQSHDKCFFNMLCDEFDMGHLKFY
ncbi:7412_t:CDS:2 [Entrophospora sp. SA101]|nr:4475_t:CDS:2 [Entrophospora sp. SA101]CAJ0632491.1 7412_t:CDS:2 [Entrophospora sp. SA101]CAJ0908808.1 11408_t:CDS:2 [Entrophospora sp. SA101]